MWLEFKYMHVCKLESGCLQAAKENKEDAELQATSKKEVATLLALKAELEKAEAGCAPPSPLGAAC